MQGSAWLPNHDEPPALEGAASPHPFNLCERNGLNIYVQLIAGIETKEVTE
jgi:hypothetical protein